MAHIMVIDDALDLCLLMRLTLEADGHQVTTVEGGAEALHRLDELVASDLLVLDVQMPVVDGWSVLAAVRNHPQHADVPVLMCTVKCSNSDLVRAWGQGCDGFLNKPFDLSALTSTVTTILSSDRKQRRGVRDAELAAALTARTPTNKGLQ